MITGIVTNEQGTPIPGVTLRRKGGANGAVSLKTAPSGSLQTGAMCYWFR